MSGAHFFVRLGYSSQALSPREFIRISLLCVCKFIFCFGLSIHTDIILVNQPPLSVGEWRKQQEANCII